MHAVYDFCVLFYTWLLYNSRSEHTIQSMLGSMINEIYKLFYRILNDTMLLNSHKETMYGFLQLILFFKTFISWLKIPDNVNTVINSIQPMPAAIRNKFTLLEQKVDTMKQMSNGEKYSMKSYIFTNLKKIT